MEILAPLLVASLFALALGVGLLVLFFITRELRKPELRAQPAPTNVAESAATPKPASISALAGPKPGNAKIYVQRRLTDAESRFYDFLKDTVEGRYVIEIKAPLRDVLKRHGWLEWELYTMHKYGQIDFLLLEPNFKRPLLAIELDDSSHASADRQAADRRKDELLRRANLRLIRIRVGKLWGDEERSLIREALPHN